MDRLKKHIIELNKELAQAKGRKLIKLNLNNKGRKELQRIQDRLLDRLEDLESLPKDRKDVLGVVFRYTTEQMPVRREQWGDKWSNKEQNNIKSSFRNDKNIIYHVNELLNYISYSNNPRVTGHKIKTNVDLGRRVAPILRSADGKPLYTSAFDIKPKSGIDEYMIDPTYTIKPIKKNHLKSLKFVKILVNFIEDRGDKKIRRQKMFYIPFAFNNKTRKVKYNISQVADYFYGWSKDYVPDFWITIKHYGFGPYPRLPTKVSKNVFSMKLNDLSYVVLPYKTLSDDISYENNCVNDAIRQLKNKLGNIAYPKLIKYIDENKVDKWTVNKIIEVCDDKKQNYILYDRYLNVLKKHIFYKKHTNFMAICTNEHLYPISRKQLNDAKKYKNDKHHGEGTENIKIDRVHCIDERIISSLFNFYRNRELVDAYKIIEIPCFYHVYEYNEELNKEIAIFKDALIVDRFVVNGVLYICNKKLYKAHNLFKKAFNDLGYDFIIPFDLSTFKLFNYIAEKHKLHSTGYNNINKPSPLHYSNGESIENKANLKSFDIKKAYLNMCLKVPYVPVFDYSRQMTKYDGHKIVDTTFYHIRKLNKNTGGFVKLGLFAGYDINEEYVSRDTYVIDMCIEPKLIKNPYIPLLKLCMKEDLNLTRDIFILFVGCMQRMGETMNVTKHFEEIFNNKEETGDEIDTLPIHGTDLTIAYKIYDRIPSNEYGLLPFAHYIISRCKQEVYKTINKMSKVDPDVKIIKINTDGILYETKNRKVDKVFDKKIWKKESFNVEKIGLNINYDDIDMIHELDINVRELDITHFDINVNNLVDSLAGCGKTHFIKNELVPLIKQKNQSYIILSSMYHVINEFREENTCDIVQLFMNNTEKKHELKQYDNIIIDEIGLWDYDMLNYLVRYTKRNNNIHAFGDSNQCRPVKHNINNIEFSYSEYFKLIFPSIWTKSDNYRNGYKTSDYHNMINGEYKYIDEQKYIGINRLTSFIDDNKGALPYVICKSNKSCKFYNDNYCKVHRWDKLRNKFITTMDKIPKNRVRADINYMKDKKQETSELKQLGIYNCSYFRIHSYNDNVDKLYGSIVKLYKIDLETDNVVGDLIVIPMIYYIKYINPAYANTLYKSQCRSIPEEQLCITDFDNMSNIEKYTAMSRIKTEHNRSSDENVKKHFPEKVIKEFMTHLYYKNNPRMYFKKIVINDLKENIIKYKCV